MKKLNVTKNSYRKIVGKRNKRTRAAHMDSLCRDAARNLNLGISRWCAKHGIENP